MAYGPRREAVPPCEKHLGNDIGSRSCALVDTKGRDVCHGDPVAFHAVAMRYKTQRPVQFKIALAARPRTRCARPEAFAVARTSGRAVQTRYGGSSRSRFDVQWQPPRRWFALNRDPRRPSPTGADKRMDRMRFTNASEMLWQAHVWRTCQLDRHPGKRAILPSARSSTRAATAEQA